MPSQRKKGLKHTGVWLTQDEHKAFKAYAKVRGLTVADLIREKIYEDIKTKKEGPMPRPLSGGGNLPGNQEAGESGRQIGI